MGLGDCHDPHGVEDVCYMCVAVNIFCRQPSGGKRERERET